MRYKIIFLFIVATSYLFAEQFLDIIKDNQFLSQDDIEYMENLLQKHLPAKKVSADFLKHYFFLPDSTARKIIVLIQKKKYKDRNYLKQNHIRYGTIKILKNYIDFEKTTFHHYYYFRDIYKESYDDYPLAYTLKYCYNKNEISFGATIQKDAGESDYADYKALYLKFEKNNLKMILGNYKIYSGMLWSSKTRMFDPYKIDDEYLGLLKTNQSTYENLNLQGVAFQYGIKNILILPFASYAFLTANLSDDKIKNFDQTGYHISNIKNNVTEKTGGTLFLYKYNFGYTLLDVHAENFDKEFLDPSYHSKNMFFGMLSKFNYRNLSLSTQDFEANGKFALYEKAIIKTKKISQMIAYKYFDKYFPMWHSNFYPHYDNESEWLYVLNLKFTNKIRFNLYGEIYKQLEPTDTILKKGLSDGGEFFLNKKPFSLRLRYKFDKKYTGKETELSNNANFSLIQDINKNLYFKYFFAFSDEISDEKYKKGFLAYQQVGINILKSYFIFRITALKTALPMFAYENNINGIFQIAQYNNDDLLFFILFKKNISPSLKISFKYSNSLEKKAQKQFYLMISGRI